jgi:hypothetical protein
MNNQQEHIIITDETILSYYRENSHIDFVTMNHILIDILKNLSSDLTKTINTTINSKILSVVSNIDKNISDIDKNISLLKSDILLKFYETKKDYIEDMKNIVYNNVLSNNEKINVSIEKNNELFISKLTTFLNELIPKSQENCYTQIDKCMKNFSFLIIQDTNKLLEITNRIDNTTTDDKIIKSFIDNIDTHLTKMFSTIQQPIFNSIQSSEERTTNSIQQIKDNVLLNNNIQETLRNEMKDFLNKYKNNSQFKGNVAEVELQHMLHSILPSDEIIKVSSDTATCDVKVNRKDTNKPSILFENKYYKNRSVTTDEVKKFERDIQLQKNHGIFISQESPITYKDNFQIDIINSLIHVYIPNANYEVEKIKIAVDIIDNLSLKLINLSKNSEDEYSISKEEIEELTEEYKIFGIQKSQMLDTIKLVNKQLTDKLEEIQLPRIKKILMKIGNIENDNDFKCTFCNNWSGKNKASLGAHIRNCKLNPKNKDIPEDYLNIVTQAENIPTNSIIENVITITTNTTENLTNDSHLIDNKVKKPNTRSKK